MQSTQDIHVCGEGCEYFSYDPWRWCRTHLRQLVSERDDLVPEQADITGMDSLMHLHVPEGRIVVGGISVNKERAKTANLDAPLLVARLYDKRGEFVSMMPVDSWEQIYRARTLEEPLTELPAIIVPDELADAALVSKPEWASSSA